MFATNTTGAPQIPSGKRLHNWKITMLLMGKSTISTGPFSSSQTVRHNQRVNPNQIPGLMVFPMVFFHGFSYGFSYGHPVGSIRHSQCSRCVLQWSLSREVRKPPRAAAWHATWFRDLTIGPIGTNSS